MVDPLLPQTKVACIVRLSESHSRCLSIVLTEEALQVHSNHILLLQRRNWLQSSEDDDPKMARTFGGETEELTYGLRQTTREVGIPVENYLGDVMPDQVVFLPIFLRLI